jgi:hypothetical protein
MKGESGSPAALPANAKGFGIFPGTIVIDSTGTVTDFNTPVEPNDLWGRAGHSLLGTSKVIVALGSLYKGDANKPAASGTLFTVTVNAACTLKITPETDFRGGVVDVNALAIAVTPNPLNVTLPSSPNPPTGLTASDGTAATTITVSWTAPVGGTTPTGYDVYKSFTNNTATATLIGSGGQTSPFVYTVANTGVPTGALTQTNAEGRTHYFWVKAKSGGGDSAFSNGDAGYIQECIKSSATTAYAAWVDFGRPNCWGYQRACRGDGDGIGTGLSTNKIWVDNKDLSILASAFNKIVADAKAASYTGIPGICGENNRTGTGLGGNKIWVDNLDLGRLATYFNQIQTNVPVCDATWASTYINFWKN